MLYISRMVQSDNSQVFGVYDTDDSSEELCTWDELDEAVACRLKISGVSIALDGRGDLDSADDVWPAQIPEFKKQAQERVDVLYGVEFVVYKDGISFVMWTDMKKSGCSIRLSSIASHVWDYAFLYGPVTGIITFILDDKITLSEYALAGIFETRAKLDIRSLTKPELVEHVYREVINNSSRGSWAQLIDNKTRRDKYRELHPQSANMEVCNAVRK